MAFARNYGALKNSIIASPYFGFGGTSQSSAQENTGGDYSNGGFMTESEAVELFGQNVERWPQSVRVSVYGYDPLTQSSTSQQPVTQTATPSQAVGQAAINGLSGATGATVVNHVLPAWSWTPGTTSTATTAPSTPVVVGAHRLSEAGAATPYNAIPAAIVASTADYAAQRYGNNNIQTANAGFNPVGQLRTNLTTVTDAGLRSGDRPITNQERAAISGSSYAAGGSMSAGANTAGGAAAGRMFGPWGTIAAMSYDPLFSPGRGIFGSSRGEEEMRRADLRRGLQEAGITNQDNILPLYRGSFDVGQERTPAGGMIYNTPDVAFAGEVVGMANPFALIATQGDEWATPQMANFFTNAALSSANTYADARNNMLRIAAQFGTPDEVLNQLNALRGTIGEDRYQAATLAVHHLIRGNGPQYTDNQIAQNRRQANVSRDIDVKRRNSGS